MQCASGWHLGQCSPAAPQPRRDGKGLCRGTGWLEARAAPGRRSHGSHSPKGGEGGRGVKVCTWWGQCLPYVQPDFDGKWAPCTWVFFSSQEWRWRGNVEVSCPSHVIALMTTPPTQPVRFQHSSQSGNSYCKTLSHLNLVISALLHAVSVLSKSEISRGNNQFQKCKVHFHDFLFWNNYNSQISFIQIYQF